MTTGTNPQTAFSPATFAGTTEPVKAAWYMLAILVVMQTFISLAIRAVGPLGPFLQEEWSLTVAQVGLFQSAIFFGQVMGGIPAGGLSDRLGVRKTLLLAPALIAVSYFIMSGSRYYALAILLLIIAGLGQVIVHGSANKGIIQWFPPTRRGLAVGIKQAAVSAGSMLAALVLPPIGSTWGWKAAIIGTAAVIGLLSVMAFAFYRDPAATPNGGSNSFSEARRLLANKAMLILGAYAFLMGGVQMSATSYLVLYLNSELHYNVIIAGTYLAMLDFWGVAARIGWGSISDRWFLGRREKLLQLIAIISVVGTVALSTTHPGSSPVVVVLAIALLGISAVGFHGVWMTLASEIGSEVAAATATGISLTMGAMGIALVTPVVGSVVDWTGSYRYGWLTCAGISVLAFLLAWWGKVDPHGTD